VIRLRHRESGSDAGAETVAATAEAAEEHPSPGLHVALSGHAGVAGARVLDLGPAVPANVAFMSGFASHLRIVDLLGEGADRSQNWAERLAEAIGPFDLVLVWDLLSRLDPDRAHYLIDVLHRATRPGGALFLMVYEGSEMPREPIQFEIARDDRVRYRLQSDLRAPAPRIPPADVARRLLGFRIDASFVLRHGVREYVAVRDSCDQDHIS
jgi:hypothetical protein